MNFYIRGNLFQEEIGPIEVCPEFFPLDQDWICMKHLNGVIFLDSPRPLQYCTIKIRIDVL